MGVEGVEVRTRGFRVVNIPGKHGVCFMRHHE